MPNPRGHRYLSTEDKRAGAEIIEWLIDGAQDCQHLDQVLQVLCDRLWRAELPLDRVAIFDRTLHPNIMGRRFLWQQGQDVVVTEGRHDILTQDTYLKSPVATVFASSEPLRRHLARADCTEDFDIVAELRAEGFTDYLVEPLPFVNGPLHAISWSSRHPAGFTDGAIDVLKAICRPLARIAEIHGLRHIAVNLLNTYVGRDSGDRILRGQVQRGDIREIHAVIFFSDLRGFTRLSEEQAGPRVLERLNSYFDCIVPPIEDRGGEILKFMGDGLLAIFPIEHEPTEVCLAALAAAHDGRERMIAAEDGAIRCGMALHVGHVLYGNIGGPSRLDFTTIGPAVNRTARLENLARDLGRDVVLSADFARHCPDRTYSLGRYELRGIDGSHEVFAPRWH